MENDPVGSQNNSNIMCGPINSMLLLYLKVLKAGS